ncbi:MAG: formylglycine-generating enzyme family protein, partial [Bacteroidota bacterium]
RENRPIQNEFMRMIHVEGGSFTMGSVNGRSDREPPHKVLVSSFKIGQHEITNAQWKQVMGTTPPSRNRSCAECPVENVSWSLAQRFINALDAMYPTHNYRLPTEAEWEYAARGGQRAGHEIYPGTGAYLELAWLNKNASGRTHQVMTKQPNVLQLYDMAGNVAEWCSDYYEDEFYKSTESRRNPTGPTSPSMGENTPRVVRGGSFRDGAEEGRVFHRSSFGSGKSFTIGFRIARDI